MHNIRNSTEYTKTEIEKHASNMRNAIEYTILFNRPKFFENFPSGSCGDASLLLGTYLHELGFNKFQRVLANRVYENTNIMGHSWLSDGELVVDITVDQFPDSGQKVIVDYNSKYHKLFKIIEYKTCNLSDYDYDFDETIQELFAFYEFLKFEILDKYR